jgi:hypothetical protein
MDGFRRNTGSFSSANRFTLQKQPLAVLQRVGANSFAVGNGHPISVAHALVDLLE